MYLLIIFILEMKHSSMKKLVRFYKMISFWFDIWRDKNWLICLVLLADNQAGQRPPVRYWQIFDNAQYKLLWVTFLAETSKDLEIILIIIVLSFTNRLSRTSLYLSLKTSFVYSNLFSLAKTVTIRCYIQTSKRVRSPSSACKKARATAKNYNPSIISLLPLAAML